LAATPVLEAMQRCLDPLRSLAGPLVAVHISAESGLPALALDDASLEKVLSHLVRNAAEAMPEGGTVRITARKALSRIHPSVLLHVSDDGPGIPAYAMEHIFKPGFSSKRNVRSWDEPCGLGLTVVRDLVEGVGGGVEVASTRRRGTTFELRIPCASAVAAKSMS
jgi:signal transduction histidine kinase